ncbi:MAG: flippase [Desulfomonile sp.]|nr:flippase [Desulfomonile sp.]
MPKATHMGKGASVFANTLSLWLPDFFNPLLSFALIWAISRYLGADGLGEYSLVLAYAGIFQTLASLGLVSLIVREVARKRDEVHVFLLNSTVFGIVSSLIALIAMIGLVYAMGYERRVFVASVVMAFSLLPSTPIWYMDGVFRAFEKSHYVAITYLAENILRVAACMVLVVLGYGIVPIFVVSVAVRVFALALMALFYWKVLGRPRWEFRPDIWRLLLTQSPVFLNIVIFSTIHLNIDQIMLSKLKDVHSVGIYSAAMRLLTMCVALPLAFSNAVLPFFTREYVQGAQQLQSFVANACRHLFLGTFPVVVGTVVLADHIITLIYGSGFAASVPVLRVLIIALVPFGMVFTLAQVLIATDNQKVDMTINMVSAGINVALNFVLIPLYGEMGCVLANLGTIIIFNELQYAYIKKHLFSLPLLKLAAKPFAAAAGMGAVTLLLRDWNIVANVAFSAAIYCLLVYLFRAVSTEEIAGLRRLASGLFPGR